VNAVTRGKLTPPVNVVSCEGSEGCDDGHKYGEGKGEPVDDRGSSEELRRREAKIYGAERRVFRIFVGHHTRERSGPKSTHIQDPKR
jgi:hypothetical protein